MKPPIKRIRPRPTGKTPDARNTPAATSGTPPQRASGTPEKEFFPEIPPGKSRAPRHTPSAPEPTKPANKPLTYTIAGACQVTGLSRATLYRHAAAGRLELVKVGGRRLVPAQNLRLLLGLPE
ncbi:helix-turn-helix domain-containing protein [Roseomonas sp. GC11]|uniref:helix-turn-helix domain-containing protein n=1 Tax=Roseomonas sp. GC11 TaxID=2950546 RepID=UPI00210B485C|nr:excisionase family DNA-binding protein [Roseomonas sp. GC11]MCQ4161274.1 helix-turn-helix domain-containing protein [Roseomonas sp. GC11]